MRIPMYCGATGVARPADVAAFRRAAAAIPTGAKWPEVVPGILFNDATLNGEDPGKSRYPSLEMAATLATDLATTHMVAAHVHTASRGAEMVQKLRMVHGRVPLCAIAQINMPDLTPGEFAVARGCFEGAFVIAQVSRGRYADSGWLAYARALSSAGADALLIDSSRGEGLAFDMDEVARAIKTCDDAGLGRPLGVAGGLGPGGLDKLLELRHRLGQDRMMTLNFNAESNLREGANPRSSEFSEPRVRGWFEAFLAARAVGSAEAPPLRQ